MDQLLDAIRKLSEGPTQRQRRVWQCVPALLQDAERAARARNRAALVRPELHIAGCDEILTQLRSTHVSALVGESEEGRRQLLEAQRAVAALAVRYAAPRSLPDPVFRELVSALGDTADPFGRVRCDWTTHFAPGRECVPASESWLPGADSIIVRAGVLRIGASGHVAIRRSVLAYLWGSRLARGLRRSAQRDEVCKFVDRVAHVPCWRRPLRVAAELFQGGDLECFLRTLLGSLPPDQSPNARLALAARCLPHRESGRLGYDNPTAIAIAREQARRVIAQLLHASRSARRTKPARSVGKSWHPVASWVHHERLTELGRGSEDSQRLNDDSELRAWSAAPELFARDDVLIGIVRDVRYGITEHLRGNYREHALQASLHPNAEQIEDVLENLERNMRGLSALGHSAAREPLLTELLALLHDNDEKVVERAAVAASLLRWSQVALCALEPRLIQLMSAGGSERPIIYLAAYAAAVLGSVQTPVLDFIHDSHWARRLRRRVGAKQRESLESRVLCRLESSYSTSELVNTLRGLNRVPSYVVRRHVRCIHQLLGDPRPDVATAAANALVALATCRRGLEVQPALQRSVLAAERRIKIVLDGRLLDLHAHLLRAIVISPPNSLPSLDSATLARLVTDTTTSVRDAAIELATITLKKNDESLLRALELELSGRSTHAWDAVAELWHEWKVSDRTAAVIDEKLALVLSRHDLVAWRYELLRKMGLVESADDECLWYALCRRLEKGEYIHGGTAAWQTPRSEVPAYVQRSIAQAMLHDDSQDLRDTAVTAAKALARRARITDLWTELITKSISGEYFAREGLIKLRTTVSVLTREIGYLTVALQREIPGEESWRCVVETCDALQTHSVSAELVIRAINQLGSSRTADKLQWGILTLICQVRDTELAQVSDCAIRMLESGGCDEVILLRFVLIPLAKRGDHRAINCLLGRCKNCDVLEQIVREVADVLQRLPEDQVQELLRNPNGFKDNHYAIEQLQHLASKLADRTGLQDWEFWRDLAHDSSPPQLRAVALERLAGAPGCWPLNEDEIYMIIASEEESQQPVREAVLRSLPEIYPLGLPSPVLERLVKHYRFNEDIHNVTKKLGPSALRRLIAELVKFAQSGTESGVSIDVDQRCKILELLKGAPFKSQPLALTDVWNCLYDPERAVRQATVKLVTDIGRDWLSVQCPVPSRFTPTNRPETYLLPEGLSEHLRCALTTKNSFNEPKQAALCVLRVLGPLADQPKIVDILASMVGNDTHRRSARSARRRLESLGYLIEESEGDHVPKRTACAAEGAGW